MTQAVQNPSNSLKDLNDQKKISNNKADLSLEGHDLEQLHMENLPSKNYQKRKIKVKNTNVSSRAANRMNIKTCMSLTDQDDQETKHETVNNYLDQRIDRCRGYKSQLVHENNQPSDQVIDDASLSDIHRLGQFSPSLDRLNMQADEEQEDDDIERRPTLQLDPNELNTINDQANRQFSAPGKAINTN